MVNLSNSPVLTIKIIKNTTRLTRVTSMYTELGLKPAVKDCIQHPNKINDKDIHHAPYLKNRENLQHNTTKLNYHNMDHKSQISSYDCNNAINHLFCNYVFYSSTDSSTFNYKVQHIKEDRTMHIKNETV